MEILDAEYITSSPTYKQCPPPDRPEYAFIGRSNVGKSSLINMLTNKKNLAKTSANPGKTQLINHFGITVKANQHQPVKWYLVDLPGYGYAKVAQTARHNWDNMIGSYIRKRENLACVFVLIDSRHEPQQADLDFINKLGEWKSAFVLVFTKSDKKQPPPFFISSAVNKMGRTELLDYISELNSGYTIL
jgi:GTP-binding protein